MAETAKEGKKEMEGRLCEMKERYGSLLKGGVCRYLAVGTFQWTEMRRKVRVGEKKIPKRSHQWKIKIKDTLKSCW